MFRNRVEAAVKQRPDRTSAQVSHGGLEGFSEKEVLALYQIGNVKPVEAGDYLMREGEPVKYLFLVLHGSFSILRSGDFKEEMVAEAGKGAWFGNGDMGSDGRNLFSVKAVGPAQVMEVDPYALALLAPDVQVTVYRKINSFLLKLFGGLTERCRILSRDIQCLAFQGSRMVGTAKAEYGRDKIVREMIEGFPRLPIQINKLASILLDEGASATEIVALAKLDPSIVSVVLKTVNSGYYRFQRKISDFQHAFLLLGFNQVYQILMENFLQGVLPKRLNLRELNLHSAIVSQIAFDISHSSGISKPVVVSTLGILHDMGKCAMLLFREKKPDLEMVIERLDYTAIGSLLLDTWNTPATICRSVECQSLPLFSPPKGIPEDCRENVAILHVAHLCHEYLRGAKAEELLYPYISEYMDFLGLKHRGLESLVENQIVPSLSKKIDTFPEYVREFIEGFNSEKPGLH